MMGASLEDMKNAALEKGISVDKGARGYQIVIDPDHKEPLDRKFLRTAGEMLERELRDVAQLRRDISVILRSDRRLVLGLVVLTHDDAPGPSA